MGKGFGIVQEGWRSLLGWNGRSLFDGSGFLRGNGGDVQA